MALPYTGNWACAAISDAMLADDTNAKEVARMLSTQPEFLGAIQEVIDYRNDPGYDPHSLGGDPATAVIGKLSDALVSYGD